MKKGNFIFLILTFILCISFIIFIRDFIIDFSLLYYLLFYFLIKFLYNLFVKEPKLKVSSILENIHLSKSLFVSIAIATYLFITNLILFKYFYNINILNYEFFLGNFIFLILIVIVEEVLNRFMVFKLLIDTSSNLRVITSSFIFMFAHLSYSRLYSQPSLGHGIFTILTWFLMGALLGYSYELSKNLLHPIIIHIGINFTFCFYINENIIQTLSLSQLFILDISDLLISIVILFILRNKLLKKS